MVIPCMLMLSMGSPRLTKDCLAAFNLIVDSLKEDSASSKVANGVACPAARSLPRERVRN